MSTIAKECVKSVLSQHEKFNKAHRVVQDLATLASEVGMAEFKERLSFLKQLSERGMESWGKYHITSIGRW